MIIPSIDLRSGRAVQLRQGAELLLTDSRDPVELAREFGRYGPVAIVDLDAALGTGNNRDIVKRCCRVARCRVGGGVRTEEDVRNWIRAGAEKVMIGTKATPEFLGLFPREWIIACLDARGDEVVVQGWTERTGQRVLDRAAQLTEYCSEFLFTQVEVEGTLGGCDLVTAKQLAAVTDVPLTIAGGIRSIEDIRSLEEVGCNSQLGRALYEGRIDLAEAWAELVRFDDDGLVPTVVQDVASGDLLMQAYGTAASLKQALRSGEGWYWSRSRAELWRKGATSGNVQRLIEARWDCDRDAVLFRVEQQGPACHTGADNCFDTGATDFLRELQCVLDERRQTASTNNPSYSQRLMADPAFLASKLREETEEVIEAHERGHITWECADLLYHLMVLMQASGVSLRDVEDELRSRAKPEPLSVAPVHQATDG